MNNTEAEITVAARQCSLVKDVKVEELEFEGKPLFQVTIDSYPAFESGHDLDELLRNIKRKIPQGYLLRVRLEFFI
jgi:hypothetical protein